MAFDFGQALANVGQIWQDKYATDQTLAQQKFKNQLALQQAGREQQQSEDQHKAAQMHAADLVRKAWQERAMLYPNQMVPTSSLNELSPEDRSIMASPMAPAQAGKIFGSPDAGANASPDVNTPAIPEGMSSLNLPTSEKMRLAEKQSDQKLQLFLAGQQGLNNRSQDRLDLDRELAKVRGDFALQVAGIAAAGKSPHYVTRNYVDENGQQVSETMTAEDAMARGPMKAPASRSEITAKQGIADVQATNDMIDELLTKGDKSNWSGTGPWEANPLYLKYQHYTGQTNPAQEDLRSGIGTTVSEIRHKLFGSAYTKTERETGMQFLADIENNPTELKTRLQAFRNWNNKLIGAKQAALPGGGKPAGTPAVPAASAGDDPMNLFK